jgi:hypothetical protein
VTGTEDLAVTSTAEQISQLSRHVDHRASGAWTSALERIIVAACGHHSRIAVDHRRLVHA